MKVLISPMAAMAETGGPTSRCRLLVQGFKNAGIEVATCMAKDVNYKEISGVKNFFLDVPMPMGMPEFIAKRSFPVAQKLGITSKKRVTSFDQVLWLTGNLDYKYLKKSVESFKAAINEFKPDIVYSEFNISAMIAAKALGVKLYSTVSFPTQHIYAHDAKKAQDLNRLLTEMSMQPVESALQLFDWADKKICPSIPELEPFSNPEVVFCGTLKKVSKGRDGVISSEAQDSKADTDSQESGSRNKILVYMGNGTISASKTLEVIREAYSGSSYQVYIASSYLKEQTLGNIHVAPRWDFNQLLDESVLFINHGGQNSIVDGLLHGVPQIMVPGKVFERIYNAKSVTNNRAGMGISQDSFTAKTIRKYTERMLDSDLMSRNAKQLGEKLVSAGGVDVIVDVSVIG